MTPRFRTLSLLVLGLFAVATVTSLAQNKAQHKADKPGPAFVMEPFQTALSVTLSVDTVDGREGEGSFTVPAGRRLNLRYLTSRLVQTFSNRPSEIAYPVVVFEIDTSVGGAAHVTHYVLGPALALSLWGDDSAPITIRVRYPSGGPSTLSATFQYSISGDLY
jgi:hypothetical protein